MELKNLIVTVALSAYIGLFALAGYYVYKSVQYISPPMVDKTQLSTIINI